MSKLQPIKLILLIFYVLILIFVFSGIIAMAAINYGRDYNFSFNGFIDPDLAQKFGGFFGGLIGTIFSISSVFLLIYSIINQASENKKSELRNYFFKMIDYHNENVEQLSISHFDNTKDYLSKGRRAFVIFKLQISELLILVREVANESGYKLNQIEVLDIAYKIFYYGLDRKWLDFMKDKLKKYTGKCPFIIENLVNKIEINKDRKIGRTNQTNLSTYFRNMYRAIEMVDGNVYLSNKEKSELIKIYRAQLSNPELYVLFFNVTSSLGKKFKEKGFITKYSFIKNLPLDYCDGYNPKEYFLMEYEEDDE